MIAIRQPHRSGVTVLFGGTEVVPSGGTASNTVASSGGVLVVLSRGLADQTTIYSGGSETVSSGGTVHDIAVSSGGALDVAGSTAASRPSPPGASPGGAEWPIPARSSPASYRAWRASARRGGGAWHDSTVHNSLARAGSSVG
jgi:autotransporter passenger strand-loop-strand repeat protein